MAVPGWPWSDRLFKLATAQPVKLRIASPLREGTSRVGYQPHRSLVPI